MTRTDHVLLPARATSVPAARRWMAALLTTWGLVEALGEAADVAALLLSELATNALLHGRSDFEVTVSWDGAVLHVEVADESVHGPVRTRFSTTAATGRGMTLVDELSRRWGVEARDGGKAVWFEVEADDSVVPAGGDGA